MSEVSPETTACPTCGPTTVEQHPRRAGVTRCANCKEWLRTTTPETDALVHWIGEGPTSLHGNGAASFERGSGDEDEVTCKLCHTLLARGEHLTTPPAHGCANYAAPVTCLTAPSSVTGRCDHCKEQA